MTKSADAFRTISEVAEWLDTPAHVLRFWESKFSQVKPVKRAGGRRYYRPSDMELLGGIKRLLHDDGMTIKGVQKLLRDKGVAHVAGLSQPLDDVTQAVRDAMTARKSGPDSNADTAVEPALADDPATPSDDGVTARNADDSAGQIAEGVDGPDAMGDRLAERIGSGAGLGSSAVSGGSSAVSGGSSAVSGAGGSGQAVPAASGAAAPQDTFTAGFDQTNAPEALSEDSSQGTEPGTAQDTAQDYAPSAAGTTGAPLGGDPAPDQDPAGAQDAPGQTVVHTGQPQIDATNPDNNPDNASASESAEPNAVAPDNDVSQSTPGPVQRPAREAVQAYASGGPATPLGAQPVAPAPSVTPAPAVTMTGQGATPVASPPTSAQGNGERQEPPRIPTPLLAHICERDTPMPAADAERARELLGQLQGWLDRQTG